MLLLDSIPEILLSPQTFPSIRYLLSHDTPSQHSQDTSDKMNSIQRMTLFKVPDHENQKKLIEAYQKMIKDQTKVCCSLSVWFPSRMH